MMQQWHSISLLNETMFAHRKQLNENGIEMELEDVQN
jgi:hypothetical protein